MDRGDSKNEAKKQKLSADMVVIGSGSSGLTAAIVAASAGAQVIVLEKNQFPGGFSLMGEGMFAVESVIQNRDFIGITRDQAFKNHMHSTHWCANGRLVKAFIDKSADTIEWLMGLGIEYIKALTLWPDGPQTWHLIKGGGKTLVETLVKRATEKGVQVLMATPAKKLILGDKNRLTEVVAQDKDGTAIHIETKVVIIAGGSYTNNKEMVSKYADLKFEAPPIIDMKQTGDHIKMAWEAGAAPDGLGVMMSIPAVPLEPPTSHLWAASVQPLLWVNQEGERFCDESIAYYFPIAANALAKQSNGMMYSIFDDTMKKKLIEKGISVSLGVFVPTTTKLTQLDSDLNRCIGEGKAFVSDSIEDLASKISANRKTLTDTVEEYNQLCEYRHDDIFAKDSKFMQPIRKAPFYAIKAAFHIFTTLGGIKINHKTEVLNPMLETIPGLYAVGNCAAGMYGWDYDIFTTGGALGFAINSGRIAAENALEYLKNRPDET